MKLTRAQKKARLEAAAAEVIEELLEWDERNEKPNLTQIEDAVLELRQRFGQEMALTLVDGQAARQPTEAPVCAQCGEAMRYKGVKAKDVESRVGGVGVEGEKARCGTCRSSSDPARRPT